MYEYMKAKEHGYEFGAFRHETCGRREIRTDKQNDPYCTIATKRTDKTNGKRSALDSYLEGDWFG
jgi:hypothetical protein